MPEGKPRKKFVLYFDLLIWFFFLIPVHCNEFLFFKFLFLG